MLKYQLFSVKRLNYNIKISKTVILDLKQSEKKWSHKKTLCKGYWVDQ